MNSSHAARHSVTMQLFLLASVVLYLLARIIDNLWGTSVDVAHHYALIARISENFSLPAGFDTSLGEMNIYPARSHVMAAVLGYFLHSPLLGMQVMGILSVMAGWCALFYMLLSLPRKSAIVAAGSLVLLLVFNKFVSHMELHGREISSDFFYAQLVGQAFALVMMTVLMYLERKDFSRWFRYAMTLAVIYFAIGIHLLAALEILGFFSFCLLADTLAGLQQSKREAIKRGLLGLVLIAIGAILVVRHPYYAAMKSISLNNGLLHIHHFNKTPALAAYCGLIFVISGYLLRHWLKQGKLQTSLSLFKYVSSYGMAVAALCLLQIILLQFGSGSEYAVKKYVFALNTIFILECALLIQLASQKYLPKIYIERYVRSNLHHYVLPSAGVLLSFICVMPLSGGMDVSELVARERQIIERRDNVLMAQADKYNYVTELVGMPPMVNYMFTIGLLRAPRSENAINVMSGQPIKDLKIVGGIITSENSWLDRRYPCRRGLSAAGLVTMDGRCITKILNNEESNYDFSVPESTADCHITGFSASESFGRWTDQRQAFIRCPIPVFGGVMAKKMEIDMSAFLNRLPKQTVQVTVNGAAPITVVFDNNTPQRILPFSLENVQGDRLEVRLVLPDAKSPKELGISDDGRLLGVSVRSIAFK